MSNYPKNDEESEKLEKKIKELETTIGEQDGRINYLQSSGFQLANFYFVFQGVILTAIVNGNSALRCSHRWFIFSLSVLAAILNLFSLLVIGSKYNRNIIQRDQAWFKCNELQTELAIRLKNSTREYGMSSSTTTDQDKHSKKQEVASESIEIGGDGPKLRQKTTAPAVVLVDAYESRKRKTYLVVCMVLFVSFAIIVIVGCWTILCRKADDQCKHHAPYNYENHKCIRLCDQGAKCISICTDY